MSHCSFTKAVWSYAKTPDTITRPLAVNLKAMVNCFVRNGLYNDNGFINERSKHLYVTDLVNRDRGKANTLKSFLRFWFANDKSFKLPWGQMRPTWATVSPDGAGYPADIQIILQGYSEFTMDRYANSLTAYRCGWSTNFTEFTGHGF